MTETKAQLYNKQTSEAFYDERYKSGYMDEWPEAKKQRVFRVIRELDLPKTGEALDFGCGNGIFTEVIRKALPNWQVYGMDFSSVAIQGAKTQHPNCIFFTHSDQELKKKRFDFVFTHHVLEHVYKLDVVWQEIMDFMKPDACSLHILPCGNEGSFEHQICQLRTNSINAEMENRFFYEDEGHVRRLTTERMVELATNSGLKLVREYYANQYYGAVDWISATGEDFVQMITDPTYAKDAVSRSQLINMRKKLRTVAWSRELLNGVRDRKRKQGKTLKNWVGLLSRLPIFPFCWTIDRQVSRAAEAEWRRRNQERNGSEMYLQFSR